MKMTPIRIALVIFVICYIGLFIFLLTRVSSNVGGREPNESNSSFSGYGTYRIIKIEGREYIISNKHITPIHTCTCKCDSIK